MVSSEPQSTRTRILAAALRLLREGTGKVSMGAIAGAAGLSRQALYLIFEDRTDLFIALLRYVDGQRGLVEAQAKVHRAKDAVAALAAMIDLRANLNPDFKPIADAFELLRRQDPAAERAWQNRMSERRAGAQALVNRLASENRLKPELDPSVAADLLWSLTSLETWDSLVVQRGWSAEEYRNRLGALIVRAIMTDG
jgi:AcrR family transcriptional regulator